MFFKTIIKREKIQNIEKITQAWMGNNLSKEGLDNILKKEQRGKSGQPTAQEVQNDWNKLAARIPGMK